MPTRHAKPSSKSTHPSYANPIIAEAVCEIHFTLPDQSAWKPTLPSLFFKHIQSDYPEMEPVVEMALQLEVGPSQIDQSALPRQRMRFKHASKPLMLQLGKNVFTVNILPKYPGWESMRRDVLGAWAQACSALSPSGVTRIGLRYINRIERSKPDEPPANWLLAGKYIPAGVLSSRSGFLSRVQSYLDKENRVLVTLAELQADEVSKVPPLVLDIDRIVEKPLAIDEKSLAAVMDNLHEDIWQIFDSVKTPRLTKLLKGGES